MGRTAGKGISPANYVYAPVSGTGLRLLVKPAHVRCNCIFRTFSLSGKVMQEYFVKIVKYI